MQSTWQGNGRVRGRKMCQHRSMACHVVLGPTAEQTGGGVRVLLSNSVMVMVTV